MALRPQATDLVGHQGDQRTHHQGQVRSGEAGQLVAEALAAAGRHHDQAVATIESRGDRVALAGPELGVAHVVEQGVGLGCAFEQPDRSGSILLDVFESLKREGRFGNLVPRSTTSVGRPLRFLRQRRLFGRRIGAAGDQCCDALRCLRSRAPRAGIEFAPGRPQDLESFIGRVAAATFGQLGFDLLGEAVGLGGEGTHATTVRTAPDNKDSPLQVRTPLGGGVLGATWGGERFLISYVFLITGR